MVSEIETNPEAFSDHAALYALLTEAFSPMAGRIDPPSSLTSMSLEDIARKAETEDLFLMRAAHRPVACLFAEPRGTTYSLGKLAVARDMRGRGLARTLIEAAGLRARGLGLRELELQTRVELTENHAAFAALGFVEAGRTCHPGYARATSITFRKPL
ncbi:MAG: Acetyltransferase (GNAT) family [Rhodobacteraceae bacterium HLUCCO18]|nr:MAG: Acetyltransferase (GNAT) family [Rhodobacteraceae bacterium HLUCCO18]